jgi:MOSC domain-containing protein YiiM
MLIQISRSNGGMPKRAVEGPVTIGYEGVEGDWHRNPKYHGGPDKAILMIAAEVVADLAARGYPVYPGAMGENLTVAGLDPQNWRAGQRYRVGDDVVIELTSLRQPCLQLDVYGPAIKDEVYDASCNRGDATSSRWARGGFYARVIQTGVVTAGAPVARVEM